MAMLLEKKKKKKKELPQMVITGLLEVEPYL